MIFPIAPGSPNDVCSLKCYTTQWQVYSDFSQIFLHKTWGNCNRFDSMKLLRVYYWHVKIPCRYMEHGLKDIKRYVQKHIAHWAVCYNSPLVCNRLLGALAYCETLLFHHLKWLRPSAVNHIVKSCITLLHLLFLFFPLWLDVVQQ